MGAADTTLHVLIPSEKQKAIGNHPFQNSDAMARRIQAINCPNCGAPVEMSLLQSNEIQCSHCHSGIVLKRRARPKLKKSDHQQKDSVEDTLDQHSALSTGWAIASLILGGLSIMGIFLPILCIPLNLVGLIAARLGRRSPRKLLLVAAIVVNGTGLLLGIILGILFVIYSGLAQPSAVRSFFLLS